MNSRMEFKPKRTAEIQIYHWCSYSNWLPHTQTQQSQSKQNIFISNELDMNSSEDALSSLSNQSVLFSIACVSLVVEIHNANHTLRNFAWWNSLHFIVITKSQLHSTYFNHKYYWNPHWIQGFSCKIAIAFTLRKFNLFTLGVFV